MGWGGRGTNRSRSPFRRIGQPRARITGMSSSSVVGCVRCRVLSCGFARHDSARYAFDTTPTWVESVFGAIQALSRGMRTGFSGIGNVWVDALTALALSRKAFCPVLFGGVYYAP